MNSGESPTNFKSKTTHLCLVSVMAATVMFDKLKLFSMKFISNPTLDDQNHPTRLFSHEWQNLWSCSLGPGDFHAHKENIDSTKISRDISILVRNRLEHNDPNPLYRNLRLLLPLYPIFFLSSVPQKNFQLWHIWMNLRNHQIHSLQYFHEICWGSTVFRGLWNEWRFLPRTPSLSYSFSAVY